MNEVHPSLFLMKGFCLFVGILAVFSISSCTSSSGDTVIEDNLPGIVFVERSVDSLGDPLDPIEFSPGGDLLTLVPAAPSGTLRNLTQDMTNDEGDVSDPEIFPQLIEGQYRVVFSMKTNSADHWHLYEVEIDAGGSRINDPVQLTCGSSNEVDPNYLPDGRIVFSSDRPGHLDEYERRRSTVLHILDRTLVPLEEQENCDAGEIVQISFNQSHDRNPIVLRDGTILFSRWEHLGRVNKFTVFFMEPDGTQLFVKFGSHSGVNSFLDLREREDGKLVATMMPLTGTFEGGALGILDIANEADNSNTSNLQLTTPQTIPTGREPSDNGRYYSAFPVSDGTDRYIVSYSSGAVVSDPEGEIEEEPVYGIWMLNNEDGTLKPIFLPSTGSRKAYLEAIPLMPFPEEMIPLQKAQMTANRSSLGEMGDLAASSVYDSEANRALSDDVLGVSIPRDGNNNIDFAALLADPDLQVVKEVRIIEAVPSQPGVGVDDMGLTPFERQKIIGYAPVEADGSFRVSVPADASLTLNVVDSKRRSFKVKENWLQVRPGETRTCNGCHSPRRGDPQRLAVDSIALNREPSIITPPKVAVIDFTDHIQAILNEHCTVCHITDPDTNPEGPDGGLDLSNEVSGLGFPIAYTSLVSDNMRQANLVVPGESRQSHLIERIFGEELRATGDLPMADAAGHAGLLSDDDKEIITEWIDLGGQFSNKVEISIPGRKDLDETVFIDEVESILQERCASCHIAGGDSNFVLTGSGEGNFNATIGRVNVTDPENSILLLKATGAIAMVDNGAPVDPPPLSIGGPEYNIILDWILSAE